MGINACGTGGSIAGFQRCLGIQEAHSTFKPVLFLRCKGDKLEK
jgi:hypothetical protein